MIRFNMELEIPEDVSCAENTYDLMRDRIVDLLLAHIKQIMIVDKPADICVCGNNNYGKGVGSVKWNARGRA